MRARGHLQALALCASARARRRRGRLFWDRLHPTEGDTILDLGSEDGSHIAALVPFRERVWIADIAPGPLDIGRERYGFHTVLLDESGTLPFRDRHFDIVFCSSVIEHVSLDKQDVEAVRSSRGFARLAYGRQQRFAAEIRRVSRSYFVQTPYRYFPVESHTWLPLVIVVLPRRLQLRLVEWLNSWWIKPTEVDWNLLTRRQMQELFPEAEIVPERFLGLTKSLVAVRALDG